MRQVTMMTLLVSILALVMQCSTNDSLNVFKGRLETVTAPITRSYPFSPYNYLIRTDSIRWMYDYPSGGPSRASLIVSGQIETDSIDPVTQAPINVGIGQNHLDLGVETDTASVPGIVQLAFDGDGKFLDTIPIAVSPLSGLILPASSRIFVKIVDYTLDTIQLADPHAAGGQK